MKHTMIRSAALAVIAGLINLASLAEDTSIGTIVLEENFSDYANINGGTITIGGQSITPKTAETTNAQLNNSLANNTSEKTATVTIGGTSATVYTTNGVVLVENSTAGTISATVGTKTVTAYNKSKTDTLLSGKVGTGTTVAGKALSSNVVLDNLTFGSKTYNGNGAKEVTCSDLGAVPTSRTVAGKPLTSNVTLTASDVGALASSTTHVSGDLALSNVKINNTAATSSTVIELGNAYILFTTSGGKTTATLYSR